MGDGIYCGLPQVAVAERVKNRLLATDSRKIFKLDSQRNGKVKYETCLITPFSGKKYCFKKYLKGIGKMPLDDMCAIIYDNSNSARFRKDLRKFAKDCFKKYLFIVDENSHYTVENTEEYNLINKRTWEIYSTISKFIPYCENVFIVEDDVEVPEGSYEKFASILDQYPEVGTVVGNVLNRRDAHTEGFDFPIVWDIVEEKHYPSGKTIAKTVCRGDSKPFGIEAVGSAHTGCWMTRTPLIKKLGFVWKQDGIDFVDQTWGYRLNKAGYKMVVDWSVKCNHYYQKNGKTRSI